MNLVIEDIGTAVLAPSDSETDFETSDLVRVLERNEMLFETGDIKTQVYMVETGALCLYMTHPDGAHEIIEFALAGDLVGMGFLERHAASARAVVDTRVRCLPLSEVARLTSMDARLKSRFDDAVEREFAFRRNAIASEGLSQPLARLAAFLVAVARQNQEEGRDPAYIDDTLECAVVAGYLGVSVEALETMLVELETRGIIRPSPRGGLCIAAMDRLENLSDEVGRNYMLQSDLPDIRRLLPGS